MFDFDDVPEEDPAPEPEESSAQGGSADGPPPAAGAGTPGADWDPYGLLGVPHDATDAAIKSAFRKVSLKVHPDHNPSSEAAAQFRALVDVKEFLLSPEKRLWYNLTHGLGQVSSGVVKWWVDWDELFNELEPGDDVDEAAPGPPAPLEPGRSLDILVVGATGLTGMLACSGVQQLCAGRSWAMAGRNERKLRLVEEKFGRGPGFRGATRIESAADIEALARNARVVVDLTGPKFVVGSGIAEACVRVGAHYIDTSGFEGDVLHARLVKDKLDGPARNNGVALVFFCGGYMTQVDFDTWRLVRHLREEHGLPTRRVDVYQSYQHFILGGTTRLSWVGQKDFASEVKRLGWPFLLGGERKGGPRKDDEDVHDACYQDEMHPDIWLTAGEKSAGVMITRCSCGLFDDSEPWGDKFLFKIHDIVGDKASGERGIVFNLMFRKSFEKYVADGKSPAPGQGPRERVRKEGVPTRIYVAEADEPKARSRRRRFHCVTSYGPGGWGNPDEGTASTAVEVAMCLLDALDAGQQLRPGFGTPTWHLAHLGFDERLRKHGHMSEVADGFPSRELFATVMQGAMHLKS